MTQKQRIIIKHINGISNRSIAKELHISKDTVNKYVSEYKQKKQEILTINPDVDTEELIQAIVEKSKYNAENREPSKVTPEILEAIEECLKINEWRRANAMSKQQMGKIDIYEYITKKKNFNISYSTVKRLLSQLRTGIKKHS